VDESFSQWESVEAGLAREKAARAVGRVAAAGGSRLAARAEAVHAASRAVERYRRHKVAMAEADAVRDQEAEAQAEAGRVQAQRRQVIAAAEANLWTARHEWQRDQTADGLEGWGLGGERSEEERQWRRSMQEGPRVLSVSLCVPLRCASGRAQRGSMRA
jgi:hypothetical protein